MAGSAPEKGYLCSYEDVRDVGHADFQLGHPLLLDVVIRGGIHHREADQEDVGVRIGQGSQLVVVLLQGENSKCVMGCGIAANGGITLALDELLNTAPPCSCTFTTCEELLRARSPPLVHQGRLFLLASLPEKANTFCLCVHCLW